MARYIQQGSNIDYVNAGGVKVAAGDVVALGKARVGIAACDIEAGATGTVALDGIFAVEKDTATEVKVGDALYYSTESKKLTKTSSDIPAGWAVADAASEAAEAFIRLDPPAAAAE